MRASRLLWPTVLVVLALTTGACSGSSTAQGTQTSSSTTATVPAVTPSSASPSPSASADPATAAKAAYVAYVQAVDRAYGNPEKATRTQLSQVATNGALTFLLSQLDALRKDKVHQKGSATVQKMTVKSVSPASGQRSAQVFMNACVDFSHSTYVDAQGKPYFPGEKDYQLSKATVNLVHDHGDWLVADETNAPVRSC